MLTLILGPMFSGKSTELIKNMRRSLLAKKKTCLVRPNKDSRPHLTHDFAVLHPEIDMFILDDYSQANPDIEKILSYQTIGIDEWQFFPSEAWMSLLFPMIKTIQDRSIDCYIASLSNNFYLKPFEILSHIIPLANHIELQTAICIGCGGTANYTSLRGAETTDEVVGSEDKYDALCWCCYTKHHSIE
ncbi:MAG: hypothetical protein ACRCVN_02615 [Spirochaetia bacterium]